MNRMRHILFFLPVAILLAACTQDELTDRTGETLPEPIPLQLTAAIGEAVATPPRHTRHGGRHVGRRRGHPCAGSQQ